MNLYIKKRVKKPKNTYNINVQYVHGDGDAYTDLDFDFKDSSDKIKEVLSILLEAKNISADKYSSLIEEKGLYWDDWWQFFDTDSTTLDKCARIKDVTVTYFDENGIEYEVEINTDENL